MTCMRYIELNPVHANMVNDPAQYRWSSYRHNGLAQVDERITSHLLYHELGKEEADRLAAYRALFRSELDEAALSDIHLGCDRDSHWAAKDSARSCVQPLVCGVRKEGRAGRWQSRISVNELRIKPILDFEL